MLFRTVLGTSPLHPEDFSESSCSLSPPVPDAEFDTHAAARQKMFARLDKHQALNDDDDDDTVHFLRSVFRFLPIQGQVQLAVDAEDCNDDDQLRQLAKHLDTAFLRPMVVTGGQTPTFTPSVCPEVESDSTTRELGELRRACLQRDNHQCVVTKIWDPMYDGRPPDLHTGDLEAPHIIPFGLGNFRHDERLQHAQIWQCMYRYFPTIRDRFHHSNEDITRIDNAMMLVVALHLEFGRFSFILEETNVSDRYSVKTFPQFGNTYLEPCMHEDVILASHDSRYPVPSKFLLAGHAAVGNILHATGRAELIAKSIEHLEEGGCPTIAKDGSTNITRIIFNKLARTDLSTTTDYDIIVSYPRIARYAITLLY
ncbi:hypothetical protein N7523_003027 [Penicillium sp. IBT 18751x]|nr:hypothetical protein N7523_003027 [Penicillium sp. IBT 18751x]